VHPKGQVVSASYDGTVQRKDFYANTPPAVIKQGGDGNMPTSLSLLGKDWLFAAGYDKGLIELWNMSYGGGGQLGSHRGPVNGTIGMFNSLWNRAFVISASQDSSIKAWDPARANTYVYDVGSHSGPIYSFITGNGIQAISGSEDNTIKIWNPFASMFSGSLLKTLYAGQAVSTLVFIPAQNILVSGSKNSTTIKVWDLSDLTKANLQINAFDAPSSAGGVASLVAFPNGSIATGQMSGDILLWNPLDKEPFLYPLPKKHQSTVTALAVLNDGSLASGSEDRTINWWTSK
jgi:WD40 repeat protein